MERRRTVAVVLLAVCIGLFGLWLALRPRPAGPERPTADREARAVPELEPGRVAPLVRATAPEVQEPDPETPLPARLRMWERLAEEREQLHVRCYVGEEYAGVRGVEGGWWSKNTDEREGSAQVGDIHHDTLLVVRWSAPPGASQAECVPEEPRWGYLTVVVTEEQGGPANGVGVEGCGVLHETGDDGRVEFPVLVRDEPCTLGVYRWDGVDTHSQAYIRVAPLAENEARTVSARLQDFATTPEAPMLRFGFAALEEVEGGVSGVPELLPEPTVQDEIDDYEDRLASSVDFVTALERVLARTPDDERWAVEEALERGRNSVTSFRAHLDELEDGSGDPD